MTTILVAGWFAILAASYMGAILALKKTDLY